MMPSSMIPSKYKDTFARDNLPPQDQWPEFLFTLPELQYPDRINCVDRIRRQVGDLGAGRSHRDHHADTRR